MMEILSIIAVIILAILFDKYAQGLKNDENEEAKRAFEYARKCEAELEETKIFIQDQNKRLWI